MLDQISNGRTDLVVDYMASGGPADSLVKGASVLQWCAYYGDVSAIRLMLDRGLSLTSLGPNFDLNGAAFHGHWQLCEFLIERGADVRHALPGTGETPLHAALCSAKSVKHARVVEVLLSAGADPNATTFPGVETGAFMRDVRTRGETPLHRAAAYGTIEALRALIDAGASREAKDANGDTPLTWASWALRDAEVLAMLCYPPFSVDPRRSSMESNLAGRPSPQGA